MEIVEVIVLSDQATVSLPTPTAKGLRDADVDFRVMNLPRLNGEEGYRAALRALTEAKRCVVVMDLTYDDDRGEPLEDNNNLNGCVRLGATWLPRKVVSTWPRWPLAGHLIETLAQNLAWSGVLALSSRYLKKGTQVAAEVVQLLQQRLGVPGERRVEVLYASVDEHPCEAINEAQSSYLTHRVLDPVLAEATWYLSGWRAQHPSQPWFHPPYHDFADRAMAHVQLVRDHFPWWASCFPSSGQNEVELNVAKALLRSAPGQRKKVGRKGVPPEVVGNLFPGLVVDNVASANSVVLPFQPAFPFLLAARNVLSRISSPDAGSLLLTRRARDAAEPFLVTVGGRSVPQSSVSGELPEIKGYLVLCASGTRSLEELVGPLHENLDTGEDAKVVLESLDGQFCLQRYADADDSAELWFALTERSEALSIVQLFHEPEGRLCGFAWPDWGAAQWQRASSVLRAIRDGGSHERR